MLRNSIKDLDCFLPSFPPSFLRTVLIAVISQLTLEKSIVHKSYICIFHIAEKGSDYRSVINQWTVITSLNYTVVFSSRVKKSASIFHTLILLFLDTVFIFYFFLYLWEFLKCFSHSVWCRKHKSCNTRMFI